MSDPNHAPNCPCLDTSKHNPRALPGALPVPPKPEPLYPRGPDNTSDAVDAELDGLRARVAELEWCLRSFVDGYPNGEWEGLLHEEGCIGVRERKDERDGCGLADCCAEHHCQCDGDEAADRIETVLKGVR